MAALVILSLEDAAEVARVHALSMHDPWSETSMRQSLERSNVLGLGVEESGELVGIGLLSLVADEAEILTLAVEPKSRRHGVARRLLRSLIKRASERGIARILLEVAADNDPAINLYKKENFEEDGVRTGYYSAGRARPIDAILMSRRLSILS